MRSKHSAGWGKTSKGGKAGEAASTKKSAYRGTLTARRSDCVSGLSGGCQWGLGQAPATCTTAASWPGSPRSLRRSPPGCRPGQIAGGSLPRPSSGDVGWPAPCGQSDSVYLCAGGGRSQNGNGLAPAKLAGAGLFSRVVSYLQNGSDTLAGSLGSQVSPDVVTSVTVVV